MNLTTFNRIVKSTETKRHPPELKRFMENCEAYSKKNKIKNPVVMK